MVQFKLIKGAVENPCSACKSYDEGFCYKWTFPIKEDHVPCTKFRLRERIQEEQIVKNWNPEELLIEILNDLNEFKGAIIGKPIDEIYIGLDNLIENYKEKVNVDL